MLGISKTTLRLDDDLLEVKDSQDSDVVMIIGNKKLTQMDVYVACK